jgi:hypothetical protein
MAAVESLVFGGGNGMDKRSRTCEAGRLTYPMSVPVFLLSVFFVIEARGRGNSVDVFWCRFNWLMMYLISIDSN